MGRAEVPGPSQKNTQGTENMMLNEVWEQWRLELTTLAKAAVCLSYVVVLNKQCHTRVHIHTYLHTLTEPACLCVLVRSRLSLCGLVGLSNTHALCLSCSQRSPVVCRAPSRQSAIPAHRFLSLQLLFRITSLLLRSLRATILILLQNYGSVYMRGAADAEIIMLSVVSRALDHKCVVVCKCSPSLSPQFIPLLRLDSLSHPVNHSFLQSPILSLSLSPCLPSNSVW